MAKNKLIGIDDGGTFIRVIVSDFHGNILSRIKWNGGAFLLKNANAKENMHEAITSAMSEGKIRPEDVVSIGAGIAGFDRNEDIHWVKKLLQIEGISCPVKFVNDAVIAHIGAFLFTPGIVAICGTGSVILGIDGKGKQIRNYDINHYAKASSRLLTQEFVIRVLIGKQNSTDKAICNKLYQHFSVCSLSQLEKLYLNDSKIWSGEINKLWGDFAVTITEEAANGSCLAQAVCNQAACEVSKGIECVNGYFEKPILDFALIGGVANSEYINERIRNSLQRKSYHIKSEVFPPEIGALLLAMKSINIAIDNTILSNLKKSINGKT